MNGRMKRVLLSAAAGISAATMLLAGCNDDLTVASALRPAFIRTDVTIHDTTVSPTVTSAFLERVAMNGRLNQLGKSNGYEAYTLLQFLSGFFPQRDTVSVVSAHLTLRLEGWFGDSTGTLAFQVFKITQAWRAPTVRWDSLPAFDPTVRGSYSGTITADTQQIVILDLDTAMVREWLRPQTFTQYGIILVPTAACNTVRGVHIFEYDSVQFYPTLEVIVRNPGGTLDTATYNAGVDSFVGNIDDPVPNPERIFTQSGVVFRSILRFDVAFIPHGAIVNTADLSIIRDPATRRLTRFTSDSLLLAGTLLSATDSTRIDPTVATGSISGPSADTLTFNLRRPVQLWVVGNNYGILLRNSALSEFSSFSLFSFYNERAANVASRPKLRIRYAVERRLGEQ